MKTNAIETGLPDYLHHQALADAIAARLIAHQERLRSCWLGAKPFEHVVIDELLPANLAGELNARLPAPEQLPKLCRIGNARELVSIWNNTIPPWASYCSLFTSRKSWKRSSRSPGWPT